MTKMANTIIIIIIIILTESFTSQSLSPLACRCFESLGIWRRKPVDDRGLQNTLSFLTGSFDQSEYVDVFLDDAVLNWLQEGVVGATSRCCSNRPK